MIGLKGRMVVIDNSGALVAECINVLKVKTRLKSSGVATVGECSRGRGEFGTRAARAYKDLNTQQSPISDCRVFSPRVPTAYNRLTPR